MLSYLKKTHSDYVCSCHILNCINKNQNLKYSYTLLHFEAAAEFKREPFQASTARSRHNSLVKLFHVDRLSSKILWRGGICAQPNHRMVRDFLQVSRLNIHHIRTVNVSHSFTSFNETRQSCGSSACRFLQL